MNKINKKAFRCGNCTYLCHGKVFDEPCIELGKIPTSQVCIKFSPDVFALVRGQDTSVVKLEDFSRFILAYGENELRTLAAMLLRVKITRKHGFDFMQKVYYRFTGTSSENYLSNFMIAYVLDANEHEVRLVGKDSPMMLTVINDGYHSNAIYPVSKFNELRAQMVARKKLISPRRDLALMPVNAKRGEISSFEDVVDPKLFDPKRAKRSKKHDLVSLVSKANRSVIELGDDDTDNEYRRGTKTSGNHSVKIDWRKGEAE